MYSTYKDGTPTADHINDFLGIIKQLANLGIEFDDEVNGLILLNTLPELWESFRSTTINSSPSGQVTLEIAKNSIFEEEKKMWALRVFSQPDTQALVMENRGKSKTREPRRRGGKSRSKSKSGVKCYHCGQLGHMKRNCYLLKGKDKKQVEDSNTTTVASTSGGDVTSLCDRGECCHVEKLDVEWIIDSGASYHCVPKREYFSKYKAGDFGTIKMGNKSVSHIMGVGDICVQTNVGCTLTLKNVRHVLDMRMNLLFAKALDEEGYAPYFRNGNWKLTKGSMVVAKGRACCPLYKTHMKMCGGQLNTVEDEASPNLWHNRLAHMSEKGLQLLVKQSLIPIAKGEYVNPCDVCLFGKQHRVSFQKNLTRKENKLDLNKSQVFKYLQHYNAMVEKETGLKLKCIRIDNGEEYTSKEFKDYCLKHGIMHEETVPGTPQHNGVAERMNRTIVEKVRCMLRMATLTKPFWGEAINTAVYLINQSPSVPLNFEIPEKAWTGKDEEKATRSFGEGVEDLTLAKTPSRKITNEEEVQVPKDETEELIIEEDKASLDRGKGEPENFQEVQSHKDKDYWMKAMREEMNSLYKNNTYELLYKNNTYELVELPKGRKTLKNKWVFKLKKDGDKIVRYKARLVVKDFSQKKGIDFDEIFSPVVKMSSIHVVLGLAASMNLELEQLDLKTVFLHGDLHEEIYMDQPEGFEEKGDEHMVCKLKKSLYGLKQAPRQWYKKFDSFMMGHGCKKTNADPCVYIRLFPNGNFIILLLYVDDMLILGQDVEKIYRLKEELSKSFDMKDLGPAKQILGMAITRDRKAGKLWLSQEKYVERLLERFNMKHAKPVSTPLANHFKLSKRSCPTTKEEKEKMSPIPYSSIVGSLMYAMVYTRLDIAHAVCVVSRFLSDPGKIHWEAIKWIFRYLRGTTKLCLTFRQTEPLLKGYIDADMAGDLDNRKSILGYLFTFAKEAVSWQSKLQKCVALSTIEAEYIVATEASKEMLWMKRFLQELALKQKEYVVFCDSQSAIDLSKNTMYHARTKHIDLRYHWLRLVTENK
ncbi:hypothetical protein SLEP1_g26368 [Rubroshorea leprosula]|uniref:Retrovirus-related Pol polyprotein from transposon TNT 1-94 n=1 Tax=Rubroshorea leprosula TaxID=152421 RepID=A0AAV5JS91_9ROSI|nr:hypothetical protein SLEP1_g26368 [Rubroshorea leprosula]